MWVKLLLLNGKKWGQLQSVTWMWLPVCQQMYEMYAGMGLAVISLGNGPLCLFVSAQYVVQGNKSENIYFLLCFCGML